LTKQINLYNLDWLMLFISLHNVGLLQYNFFDIFFPFISNMRLTLQSTSIISTLTVNDLQSSLSTPTIILFIYNHNSHCLYGQIKLSHSTIKSTLHLELNHPKNFNISKSCWKFMMQLPCQLSPEVYQPSR
jgi:hypothetical protein